MMANDFVTFNGKMRQKLTFDSFMHVTLKIVKIMIDMISLN